MFADLERVEADEQGENVAAIVEFGVASSRTRPFGTRLLPSGGAEQRAVAFAPADLSSKLPGVPHPAASPPAALAEIGQGRAAQVAVKRGTSDNDSRSFCYFWCFFRCQLFDMNIYLVTVSSTLASL